MVVIWQSSIVLLTCSSCCVSDFWVKAWRHWFVSSFQLLLRLDDRIAFRKGFGADSGIGLENWMLWLDFVQVLQDFAFAAVGYGGEDFVSVAAGDEEAILLKWLVCVDLGILYHWILLRLLPTAFDDQAKIIERIFDRLHLVDVELMLVWLRRLYQWQVELLRLSNLSHVGHLVRKCRFLVLRLDGRRIARPHLLLIDLLMCFLWILRDLYWRLQITIDAFRFSSFLLHDWYDVGRFQLSDPLTWHVCCWDVMDFAAFHFLWLVDLLGRDYSYLRGVGNRVGDCIVGGARNTIRFDEDRRGDFGSYLSVSSCGDLGHHIHIETSLFGLHVLL